MTPESSEQPRETRDGMPLVERFDRLAAKHAVSEGELEDAAAYAAVYKANEVARAKVSSPELASLAAKYVNLSAFEMGTDERTAADVRSLAASVLAQAEGNPSK